MTLHIEIKKSYKPNRYDIRTGDLDGCIECSHLTKSELIKEIKQRIEVYSE
jgi:hypothetical protein